MSRCEFSRQEAATVDYTVNSTPYSATADSDGNFTGDYITSGTVDYITGEVDLVFSTAPTAVKTTIPPGGTVKIYPLTKDGNPTQTIIDAVTAYLSAGSKRPLTDNVVVESPTSVDFTIDADVTIYSTADEDEVLAAVEAALETYKTNSSNLFS